MELVFDDDDDYHDERQGKESFEILWSSWEISIYHMMVNLNELICIFEQKTFKVTNYTWFHQQNRTKGHNFKINKQYIVIK